MILLRGSVSRLLSGGVALLAVALIVASCGAASGDSTDAWAGSVRTPTPVVAELSLPAVTPDGDETPFAFQADEDQLLLVYFGYTSCPDVCPTTMADIALTRRALESDGERLDLAMVTIDPEVDTPEVLNDYATAFVPGATAIRTTDDSALRPVAQVFGVEYGKEEDGTVFHTGSLFAVDDQGQLRLTWPFGVSVEDLEADITRLLEEA